MNANVEEQLITLVENYPVIYDKKHDNYMDKNIKENAWNAVSSALGIEIEDCKRRWRSLRDRYVKESKKNLCPSGSAAEFTKKWCYYDAMSFLKPYIQNKRTFSSLQHAVAESQESDLPDESCSTTLSPDNEPEMSQELSASPAETPSSSKKKKGFTDFEQAIIALAKEDKSDYVDCYLPYLGCLLRKVDKENLHTVMQNITNFVISATK